MSSVSDISIDIESALVRGSNVDANQINKIIDEIERNLVKQVSVNPRQQLVAFHKTSLKILDRLFGEDTTTGTGTPLPSPWIRGPPGGWLRRLITISDGGILNTNLVERDSSTFATQTKLIDCFSPKSPFMDLIMTKSKSGLMGTNYEMKLIFLPQKIRMALNKDQTYGCVRSDNHEAYFSLLSIPLQDQMQHITSKSKDHTIMLEPMEYFLFCLVRYPLSGGPPVLTPLSHTPHHHSFGQRLSMPMISQGIESWIRPYPYLRLLNQYFKEMIPIGQKEKFDANSIKSPSFPLSGEMNSYYQLRRLFLMMVCDYWMDSTLLVRQNHHLLVHSRRSSPNNNLSRLSKHQKSSLLHPSPVDVIVLENGYSLRSMASLQCVYLLIAHIINDPTISSRFKESGDIAHSQTLRMGHQGINVPIDQSLSSVDIIRPLKSHRGDRSHRPIHQTDSSLKLLFLPSYFKIIQQPLFDMLRSIFSRNDSNASDDSFFNMAVFIWLLYIQPWKAKNSYAFGINRSTSRYSSSEWKSYIAANLHFYTTLPAMIIKSISRVDFSIQTPDDRAKLDVIEKIVDVLTLDGLWDDIQSLTLSFQTWYPKLLSYPIDYIDSYENRSEDKKKDSFSSDMSQLKQSYNPSMIDLHVIRLHHIHLFPDRTIDELDDCGIVYIPSYTKESGKALIDSLALVIFRLELKKMKPIKGNFLWRSGVIFIRYVSYYLFSNETSEFPEVISDDICNRCRRIMRRIGILTNIDVTAALNPYQTGYLDVRGMRRDGTDGIRDPITKCFTIEGKEKYLSGSMFMDSNQMQWKAVDNLDRPLASYEIHHLARPLVQLSKDLNALFDLPRDPKMRYMTWDYLMRETYENWRIFLPAFKSSIRFNLRFLSNFWYLGSMLFIICSGLLYVDRIPLSLFLGVVGLLMYCLITYA